MNNKDPLVAASIQTRIDTAQTLAQAKMIDLITLKTDIKHPEITKAVKKYIKKEIKLNKQYTKQYLKEHINAMYELATQLHPKGE